ncbi:TIGR02221 family CRISPR-associated protein [Spirochaeta dissipatitropha]
MKNSLITFLGTGNYELTSYSMNGAVIECVSFVQQAIISMAKDCFLSEDDEIVIFVTAQARHKNLEKLLQCLTEISQADYLRFSTKVVDIPMCTNETEIWELFEQLCKVVRTESVVHVDITHAFRFMPMLAIVFLDYARMVLSASVGHIWYGAFEAKCSNNGISPILDFSSFADLQQWNSAVDSFLNAGDAKLLLPVLDKKLRVLLAHESTRSLAVRQQQNLAKQLTAFTENIRAVRGEALYQGKEFTRINQSIEDLITEIDAVQPPLKRLLKAIRNKINGFQTDSLVNGIAAARWCAEHDLLQQGITILQETHISLVLDSVGLDYSEKGARNIVGSLMRFMCGGKTPLTLEDASNKIIESKDNQAERQQALQVISVIVSSPVFYSLGSLYSDLRLTRNDINHAGITSNSKVSAIRRAFLAALDKSESIVKISGKFPGN